jgi:hypothetical protein
MIQRKQELIDQLRTIDDHADAHFNNASFDPDGIVLSGIITLVGRKSPVISFDKTIAQDGYSALLSWFPGGWINRFDWTWSWSGRNDPGAANYQNRFVLRRPPGQMGRWGGAVSLTQPLPGIDGAGSVCLRVEGVQVDSVTGALVPVTSTRLCHQFGLRIGMTVSQAAVRPLSRQVPNRPRKPQPEQALAVRGDPLSGAASNTLVLYVDSSWDQETALALKGALEISPGRDKALTLLVLFKEGLPDVSEARIAAEVEAVGHSLGVPTVVNEDVRGGWAGALVVPAGSVGHSWRLMAPGGGVTWVHQGRISAHELAAALDHYLIPSQPSKPTSLHPTVAIGMRISPAALVPDLGIQQAHCPPPPIRRIGTAGSVVAFVQADSPASRSHLRALSAQYRESGKNGPTLVAVLDGGDAELARRIKKDLGFDASVLPDPIGKVADRFGVRIWPTTLTLDRIGTVAGVEVGIRDIGRDPQPSNSVSSVAQEDAGD